MYVCKGWKAMNTNCAFSLGCLFPWCEDRSSRGHQVDCSEGGPSLEQVVERWAMPNFYRLVKNGASTWRKHQTFHGNWWFLAGICLLSKFFLISDAATPSCPDECRKMTSRPKNLQTSEESVFLGLFGILQIWLNSWSLGIRSRKYVFLWLDFSLSQYSPYMHTSAVHIPIPKLRMHMFFLLAYSWVIFFYRLFGSRWVGHVHRHQAAKRCESFILLPKKRVLGCFQGLCFWGVFGSIVCEFGVCLFPFLVSFGLLFLWISFGKISKLEVDVIHWTEGGPFAAGRDYSSMAFGIEVWCVKAAIRW